MKSNFLILIDGMEGSSIDPPGKQESLNEDE